MHGERPHPESHESTNIRIEQPWTLFGRLHINPRILILYLVLFLLRLHLHFYIAAPLDCGTFRLDGLLLYGFTGLVIRHTAWVDVIVMHAASVAVAGIMHFVVYPQPR